MGSTSSLLEWLAMFLFHRRARTQKHTHRRRTHYTNAVCTELCFCSCRSNSDQSMPFSCPLATWKDTGTVFRCLLSRATAARISQFADPLLCPRSISLLEMNGTDPLCSTFSPELVLPGDGSATSRPPFSSLTDVKTGHSKFHAHHCSSVPALLSHLLARDLGYISLAGAHLIL